MWGVQELGIPKFRGRWLFRPHHLHQNHAECKRKRKGLDTKEVFEACDDEADVDDQQLVRAT